ncbi:hypothetical protein TcasGA2_TC032959 [Tribolium castaneum]|uniref:Uncharacterized protein n=1 Tax=Tribolium castaneum TaxID=7070 RepID=A0A139WIB5_TRICA|nr:hypothetical protein TcasGA2_TC032959 [Tribolium castaneum]
MCPSVCVSLVKKADAIKTEWMASSQIEDRKGLILSRFFSTIESKQNLLITDLDEIRTDVDKIRTDVDKIRTDVNELSTDVKQLPQTIRLVVREEIQNAIHNETPKQLKNLLKLGFDNL